MKFKWFYKYVRVLVVILLIAFAFIHFEPDIKHAGFNMTLLKAMVIVQPILLLSFVMMAIRYNILLGIKKQPFFLVFKAILLITALGTVLPGKISELLRPTYLKEHSNLPAFNALMALGAEKVIDTFILGLLSLVFISISLFRHLWIVWVLAGCLPIAILAFSSKLSKQANFLIKLLPGRFQLFANRVYLQVCQIARTGTLLQALVVGFLVWGLSLFSVYTFFYFALPEPLSFHQVAFIFILTTLGSLVPLLPAGFGFYEAASIFALTKFGYQFDYAVIISICLHLSHLGLPVIFGFFVAICNRTGASTLLKQGMYFVRNKRYFKK